jgi:16S rRNA (adenine1518-N6/adenine1519-N6)-dimethyltransferase
VAGLRLAAVQLSRPAVSGHLGPAEVRALVRSLQLVPRRSLGQNFVVDPNTVRRIVRTAAVQPTDRVLEIGPGLGSLTLGLLDRAAEVLAVEVDARLAAALPGTVQARAGPAAARLRVLHRDAAELTAADVGAIDVLVANLPYRVAVPVLLHVLAALPGIDRGLVMVQAEVADRLTASPGGRSYGVPSVKLAWYAAARRVGTVPRTVFWPVPNVDSALVAFARRPPPAAVDRERVFAIVDAAFRSRRKTLRAGLSGWAGSPTAAERWLRSVGIAPEARAESLSVVEFGRLAQAAEIPT